MTNLREVSVWEAAEAVAVSPARHGGSASPGRQPEVTAVRMAEADGLPKVSAPTPSDDELILAVIGGDEMAFAALFERYRRMVGNIAYSFFPRREQVEEVVQESFAKAYFALGSYRGGHQKSFAAWLSRTTVRTCYDLLRQSRRGETTLSDLGEEEAELLFERLRDEGVSQDAERSVVSRDLAAKLMERLEPEDRMVLALLEVAGYSVAEIAELTGWSVPKVKMRAFRARGALRRVLHRFV